MLRGECDTGEAAGELLMFLPGGGSSSLLISDLDGHLMQGGGREALQVLDRWAVNQGREVILPFLGLYGI
jgi:hypothetical protein